MQDPGQAIAKRIILILLACSFNSVFLKTLGKRGGQTASPASPSGQIQRQNPSSSDILDEPARPPSAYVHADNEQAAESDGASDAAQRINGGPTNGKDGFLVCFNHTDCCSDAIAHGHQWSGKHELPAALISPEKRRGGETCRFFCDRQGGGDKGVCEQKWPGFCLRDTDCDLSRRSLWTHYIPYASPFLPTNAHSIAHPPHLTRHRRPSSDGGGWGASKKGSSSSSSSSSTKIPPIPRPFKRICVKNDSIDTAGTCKVDDACHGIDCGTNGFCMAGRCRCTYPYLGSRSHFSIRAHRAYQLFDAFDDSFLQTIHLEKSILLLCQNVGERRAFVTLIFEKSPVDIVMMARVWALMLRRHGATSDLIAIVTSGVSSHLREILEDDGVIVVELDAVPLPPSLRSKEAIRRWNSVFTKLRAWELEQYDRVAYMDMDVLIHTTAESAKEKEEGVSSKGAPGTEAIEGVDSRNASLANEQAQDDGSSDDSSNPSAYGRENSVRHGTSIEDIFLSCSADVCMARDLAHTDESPMGNVGVIILKPSRTRLQHMLQEVESTRDHYKYPEQEWLTRYIIDPKNNMKGDVLPHNLNTCSPPDGGGPRPPHLKWGRGGGGRGGGGGRRTGRNGHIGSGGSNERKDLKSTRDYDDGSIPFVTSHITVHHFCGPEKPPHFFLDANINYEQQFALRSASGHGGEVNAVQDAEASHRVQRQDNGGLLRLYYEWNKLYASIGAMDASFIRVLKREKCVVKSTQAKLVENTSWRKTARVLSQPLELPGLRGEPTNSRRSMLSNSMHIDTRTLAFLASTVPPPESFNRKIRHKRFSSSVIYQIITDRFYPHPGRERAAACGNLSMACGGTFAGIQEHIHYLVDLGISSVWISPHIENVDPDICYHGYCPRSLNPHDVREGFGGYDDFILLRSRLSKAGISLMADVVINHLGRQKEDLTRGVLNLDVFKRDPSIMTHSIEPHIFHDPELHGWCSPEMTPTEMIECSLYGALDLNQTTVAVQFAIFHLLRETMEPEAAAIRSKTGDHSYDALRIDAARHVDVKFLAWLQDALNLFGVQSYAEVLHGSAHLVSGYQMDNKHGLFNFPLHFTLIELFSQGQHFCGGGSGPPHEPCWEEASSPSPSASSPSSSPHLGISLEHSRRDTRRVFRNPRLLVNFIENHDVPRFLSRPGATANLYLNALCLVLFWEGVPQLYYGGEVGMKSGADEADSGAAARGGSDDGSGETEDVFGQNDSDVGGSDPYRPDIHRAPLWQQPIFNEITNMQGIFQDFCPKQQQERRQTLGDVEEGHRFDQGETPRNDCETERAEEGSFIHAVLRAMIAVRETLLRLGTQRRKLFLILGDYLEAKGSLPAHHTIAAERGIYAFQRGMAIIVVTNYRDDSKDEKGTHRHESAEDSDQAVSFRMKGIRDIPPGTRMCNVLPPFGCEVVRGDGAGHESAQSGGNGGDGVKGGGRSKGKSRGDARSGEKREEGGSKEGVSFRHVFKRTVASNQQRFLPAIYLPVTRTMWRALQLLLYAKPSLSYPLAKEADVTFHRSNISDSSTPSIESERGYDRSNADGSESYKDNISRTMRRSGSDLTDDEQTPADVCLEKKVVDVICEEGLRANEPSIGPTLYSIIYTAQRGEYREPPPQTARQIFNPYLHSSPSHIQGAFATKMEKQQQHAFDEDLPVPPLPEDELIEKEYRMTLCSSDGEGLMMLRYNARTVVLYSKLSVSAPSSASTQSSSSSSPSAPQPPGQHPKKELSHRAFQRQKQHQFPVDDKYGICLFRSEDTKGDCAKLLREYRHGLAFSMLSHPVGETPLPHESEGEVVFVEEILVVKHWLQADNYYHFLIEILPYLASENARRQRKNMPRAGVDPGHYVALPTSRSIPFVQKALRVLGFDPSLFLHLHGAGFQALSAKKIVIFPGVASHSRSVISPNPTLLHEARGYFLERLSKSGLVKNQRRRQRLMVWVRREGASQRVMSNEMAVISGLQEAFLEHGVDIEIYSTTPGAAQEALPANTANEALDDMRTFYRKISRASLIVGVHGAGLANMLFAPKRAIVIEIMPIIPDMVNYHYWMLSGLLGLRYRVIPVMVDESIEVGTKEAFEMPIRTLSEFQVDVEETVSVFLDIAMRESNVDT
eukprot:jgi/Bigna1/80808/fgenesh1_pg.74_\